MRLPCHPSPAPPARALNQGRNLVPSRGGVGFEAMQ